LFSASTPKTKTITLEDEVIHVKEEKASQET
jgi:hypothetical protein